MFSTLKYNNSVIIGEKNFKLYLNLMLKYKYIEVVMICK
ncbi:hypothetical protein C1A50_1050 [Paenibacillus polymyxa]|nr:hypothetical protein C1A50_1050 [Paenibacillus polymyxa]